MNFHKPHLLRVLALGFIELIYFYCESYGIVYTNVTCSGVILAVSPIVSTAFVALFLKELPTKRQAVFSVVAVTGVIMITVAEGIAGEIQPVGIVLLIGGCICSAVFRVINRSIVKIYTAFERTYCQTAHCGRCKPHFIFGELISPIVPYRNLPQTLRGLTADCRSFV